MTPRKRHLETSRSVLVYDRVPLEDVEMQLLGPARVTAVASLKPGRFSESDVGSLRPTETLATGDLVADAQEQFPLTISCGARGTILIALWLEDSVVLVECKEIKVGSVLQSWVEKARFVNDPTGRQSISEGGLSQQEDHDRGQQLAG